MKNFRDLQIGEYVNYRNSTIAEDVDYMVVGSKVDNWGSYVVLENCETGELKNVTAHTPIDIAWSFNLLKDALESLGLNK